MCVRGKGSCGMEGKRVGGLVVCKRAYVLWASVCIKKGVHTFLAKGG